MPCPACAAKKLLDQQSARAVKMNDRILKEVEDMWDKGEIENDQALAILEPIMNAERGFLNHNHLAQEKATQGLAAVKALHDKG